MFVSLLLNFLVKNKKAILKIITAIFVICFYFEDCIDDLSFSRKIVLIFISLIFLIKTILHINAKAKFSNSIKNFQAKLDVNTFQECLPLFNIGDKKHPHAVLLLHGFSASPQEFEMLSEYLRKNKIPYYSPMLFGFGLNGLHHLENVVKEDWIRDAQFGYDILSEVADKVSVIGHSNGGVLAIVLAKSRDINHLILSSPNIFSIKTDLKYKFLLELPVISELIIFAVTIFNKPIRAGRVSSTDTLDVEQAKKCFNYPVLPTKSLKAMWDLQNYANIDLANYQKLTVLLGCHDQTIDIPRTERFF